MSTRVARFCDCPGKDHVHRLEREIEYLNQQLERRLSGGITRREQMRRARVASVQAEAPEQPLDWGTALERHIASLENELVDGVPGQELSGWASYTLGEIEAGRESLEMWQASEARLALYFEALRRETLLQIAEEIAQKYPMSALPLALMGGQPETLVEG